MNKPADRRPVARAICELGQNIGVHGTPAIVTTDGELLSGYEPPRRISQESAGRLERGCKVATALALADRFGAGR